MIMQEMESLEQAKMKFDVDALMPYISLYGIWIVHSLYEKVKDKFTEERVTTIVSHLSDYGFVIYRLDAPTNLGVVIELTERGRELKISGSYQSYLEHLEQQLLNIRNLEADRKRDFQRNEYLLILAKRQYWVNVLIAISTLFAAIYYLYQLYDGNPKSHPCFVLSTVGITSLLLLILFFQRISRKNKN